MAKKTLLKDVAVKQDTGTLNQPVPFTATFENIIDQRLGKENYTLAQFLDHYLDYMQHADFMYYGTEQPDNSHVRIWIDTGHTNQD